MNLALFEPNRLPLREGEAWNVVESDCIEWLRSIGTETVDLIVTDPAYSSLEKHRAKGTTTRLSNSKASSNSWFPVVPNSYFPAFFAECFRALKRDTHLYVLCDQETMFAIKPMGEEAGFIFHKPIIWDKLKMGLGYHYRARCEGGAGHPQSPPGFWRTILGRLAQAPCRKGRGIPDRKARRPAQYAHLSELVRGRCRGRSVLRLGVNR